MSQKTVKQTTVEYFKQPSLSDGEIKSLETRIFGNNTITKAKNLFSWLFLIPKPVLTVIVVCIICIPALLINNKFFMQDELTVEASNFTSNIYKNTQNNIVYLEIYTDNISDQSILAQAWYDSTSGIEKNSSSGNLPKYTYVNSSINIGEKDSSGESASYASEPRDIPNSSYPSTPELAAFLRALGQSVKDGTIIETTSYKGESAYKVTVSYEGNQVIYVYFIKNTNVVYIETPLYTRKVIYKFIKLNSTNINNIFNTD